MKCIIFLHILMIIIAIKSKVLAEILSCVYEDFSWEFVGTIYNCRVQNNKIFETKNIEITSTSHNHTKSHTNNDVKGFYSREILSKSFFPLGIANVFPNLEVLRFWTESLTEIHQNDLKRLTNLRILYLNNNKLRIIEKNLFHFNPKLELIALNSNQISFVHPKVFNSLENLKVIDLSENNCSESFVRANSNDEVLKIMMKIHEKKCFTIDGERFLRNDKNSAFNLENEKKFDELYKKLADLEEKFSNNTIKSEEKILELNKKMYYSLWLIAIAITISMISLVSICHRQTSRKQSKVNEIQIVTASVDKIIPQKGSLDIRSNNYTYDNEIIYDTPN